MFVRSQYSSTFEIFAFGKFLIPILTSIMFSAFSSTHASADAAEQTKQSLRKLPTSDLIALRAANNVYFEECRDHLTFENYELFYNIASEVIIEQLIDRSELTEVNQIEYGFKKGLMFGLLRKLGSDRFCNCIYTRIMKGGGDCGE